MSEIEQAFLSHLMAISHQSLIACYQMMDRAVWKNNVGASPQEICDKLGVNAGKAFAVLDAIKDLAAVAFPKTQLVSLRPADATAIVNADGSVTIGTKAAETVQAVESSPPAAATNPQEPAA